MSNNKMYLMEDNGGYSLLIYDAEKSAWYCVETGSNGYIGNVYIYPIVKEDADGWEIEETAEHIAKRIAEGVRSGDIYGADDFINDSFTDDEYREKCHIPEWDGMTINEIDTDCNYTTNSCGDVIPLGHDYTSFYEIK